MDEVKALIHKNKKKIILASAGAVLLLGAMLALYLTYGKELLALVSDTAAFKAWLDDFGALGKVIFVGIRSLQTVVKIIPAEPLEIGSGFAYGTFGGLFLCLLGTEIGSLAIIFLSRTFGMRFVGLFVPESRLKAFDFLKDKRRVGTLLFLIYLIPGSPKDLITYFAWMLPIGTPSFMLITGIARIPSIITSTWCGAMLVSENYTLAAVIFIATAAAGIGGAAIYGALEKKNSKKKAVELPAAA